MESTCANIFANMDHNYYRVIDKYQIINDKVIENIACDSNDEDSGFLSSDEETHTLNAECGEYSKKKKRINLEGCITELPPCEPDPSVIDCELIHKATQIWSPTNHLKNYQIDNFIHIAKIDAGFDAEQAMAILYANNYDIKKAQHDLNYFAPLRSQWRKDRKRFIYAVNKIGKKFQKIQKAYFPRKSISELVEYYYTWKTELKRKQRSIFSPPIKTS